MKVNEFFIRKHSPKNGVCFVLMPFEEGMTAVYEHGIKPLVESLGLTCRRADEIYSAQGILGDVWEAIQTAEIVIADLTGKNPNVMYELGLSHAVWKKVILLSQNKDDVPFDLKAWRVLWYDFTFAGSARLKDELKRAIEALRADTDPEANIVPMECLPTQQTTNIVSHDIHNEEWLFGDITAWNAERKNGFIEANGESFYFNQNYLFDRDWTPDKDDKVIFRRLAPLPDTKNYRASDVFIEGRWVTGQITDNKGDFCFAELLGQHGHRHSLFIYTGGEGGISIGQTVESVVGKNPKGPIGNSIRVIGK